MGVSFKVHAFSSFFYLWQRTSPTISILEKGDVSSSKGKADLCVFDRIVVLRLIDLKWYRGNLRGNLTLSVVSL